MDFIVNPNKSLINSARLLILLAPENLSEAVAVFDNGERVTMPLKTGQDLIAAFTRLPSDDSALPTGGLDLTSKARAGGSLTSDLVT